MERTMTVRRPKPPGFASEVAWTAPDWQELFGTLMQHWSGAVMCPACLCGADGRWPYALRGSGPNPTHAFEDALTLAGSPDPRNDCVRSGLTNLRATPVRPASVQGCLWPGR